MRKEKKDSSRNVSSAPVTALNIFFLTRKQKTDYIETAK